MKHRSTAHLCLALLAAILLATLPLAAKASIKDDPKYDDLASILTDKELARFEVALSDYGSEWVLAFMDSLEQRYDRPKLLVYTTGMRANHSYAMHDSVMFDEYNRKTCELANKCGNRRMYYVTRLNAATFYINVGDNYTAHIITEKMLAEAQEKDEAFGLYYAHFALGALYHELMDYSRSTENFLKCMDFFQETTVHNPEALVYLYSAVATNYMEQRDYAHALRYADKGMSQGSGSPLLHYDRAVCYYELGRYAECQAAIDAYMASPRVPDVSTYNEELRLRIIQHLMQGDTDQALSLCDSIRDNIPAQLSALSRVYSKTNQWDRAYDMLLALDKYKDSVFHARFSEHLGSLSDGIITTKKMQEDAENSARQQNIIMILVFGIIVLLAIYVISIVHYRSRQRLRQERIRQAEQYRILVENLPFGFSRAEMVYASDGSIQDYRVIEVNNNIRKHLDKYGKKPGEKTLVETYPVSGPYIIRQLEDARLAGRKHLRMPLTMSEFDMTYEMFYMLDAMDGTLSIFSLNTTELEKSRQQLLHTLDQLKEAKDEAERLAQVKTQFVQNMNHEIRTPLNAIVGFAQLLCLPDGCNTEEEKQEYYEYVHNNTHMLMMLIDDLLEVADLEGGQMKIHKEEVNCEDICRHSVKTADYRAAEGVRMYYTMDLQGSGTVYTDPRRAQQIIVNFLTNACKHTKQGEIHLHCTDQEHPGHITFSVADTGTGVPPEMKDVIFERFTKLNEFVPGTGLGLSICKAVSERMDSTIYLDTTYTSGARFVFEI